MACPDCGAQTLQTPDGDHLNPVHGRLGRMRPDGTLLTAEDIRNPSVRGYYPHHCPPPSKTPTTAQSSQGSLF